MSQLEAGDSEVLRALQDGWFEGEEEPRYTPEAILRVADWLVAHGYAEPGYVERLRRMFPEGGPL